MFLVSAAGPQNMAGSKAAVQPWQVYQYPFAIVYSYPGNWASNIHRGISEQFLLSWNQKGLIEPFLSSLQNIFFPAPQ